jgi:hypothetical protein
MTREQIKVLMAQRKSLRTTGAKISAFSAVADPLKPSLPVRTSEGPSLVPPGIDTFYLAASGAGHGVVYYPAVIGRMDVHYSHAKHKVDTTETLALAAQLEDGPVALDWDSAVSFDPMAVETSPVPDGEYTDLPADAQNVSNFRKWNKDLLRWVRQNRPLVLLRSKRFGMTSQLGESEGEFRLRLAQVLREHRDLEVEKLRKKYDKQFTTLKDRLMRAEQAIDRENEQAKASKMQTAISFGSAILGAFLGRKAISATSAQRVGTAMRSASRVQKETMDVARAQERAEAVRLQLSELDARLQEDIDAIDFSMDAQSEALEKISVKPKSTDITLEIFGLAWMPFRKNAGGGLSPDWDER